MCLLTNERYKTYQTGFPFGRLGHAPGMGMGGSKLFFFRNSTRFGVWVTYMNGTCKGTMFLVHASWGLVEGPKGQIILYLNYSQFQRYLNQTLYVFSQMKDIKHIRDGIFIRSPGSCPRGGTWGYRGGLGVQNFFFFWNSSRFGVWVTYVNGTCNGTIFGSLPPGAFGRGQKVKYH